MARIYISSTYIDLAEHRRQVYKALHDRRYDVLAMEDYVACEERPLERCLADVASCQVYIGIFAWRYGYIPPGQERSITELEYRQAGKYHLERLVFLLDEDAPWPRSKMETGTGGEKIEALRQELGRTHVVSFFTDVEQLVEKVVASVDEWAQTRLGASMRLLDQSTNILPILHVPRQAPALPPNYVERSELKIIKQKLTGSDKPIIALHGMGGVGKTTLALALASDPEVVTYFKDAILWAELGSGASVENWQVAWGAGLGDDLRIYFDPETKAARLRTLLANKQCLLIIDEVWPETDVRPLLVGGQHCSTLITTRHRTVVEQLGITPLRIGVFEETEALKLLGYWAGYDLDADHDARKLVKRLGYLPLAVNLVGAQLQDGATLDELLKAFRDDHGNLGGLDLEPQYSKEHSLIKTFDLSVRRLDPEDRKRFAQLGALAAGTPFDAKASAAVWGEDEGQVSNSLRLLVRHALLDKIGDSYDMHVLLRDYALSLLDEAEQGKVMSWHTDYCLEVARKAEVDWRVTEAALDQIRVAWNRVNTSESEQVFAFVDAMTPFFMRRGLLYDARSWTERGLVLAEKLGRHDDEIRYLNIVGNIFMRLGLWQDAEKYFRRALESAEYVANFFYQSWTMQHLGCLYCKRGDFPQVMPLFQRALALAERIDARQLVGNIYNEIGTFYRVQGDYPQAVVYYEASLRIMEQRGDDQGLAITYSNLGSVYSQQGDFEEAISALNRALESYEKTGDEGGMAQVYGNLSVVYTEQGGYDPAIRIAQKGLDIMSRIGDKQGIADIYASLGNCYHKLGNYDLAIQMYQEALEIYEAVGDEPNTAKVYGNLGCVLHDSGNMNQALKYYNQSLEIAERIGAQHISAFQHLGMADLYRKQWKIEPALTHYEKAKASFEKMGETLRAQIVLQNMNDLREGAYSIFGLFDDRAVSGGPDEFNPLLDFFQKHLSTL